jgi:uncharacterized protein (TIGR02246 family)
MTSVSDRLNDEAAIRALEQAYDDAWNRGDAKGLVSSFSSDAIVVNPEGAVAVGKAEFEQVMTEVLAGRFSGSIHTTNVTRVHLPKKNIAIVDGEATLTRLKAPDGSELPPTVVKFTDVMIKQRGRWLITDVRAYVLLSAPQERATESP